MFQSLTRRSQAVWEVIAVALVLIAGSASTMPVVHANGITTVPPASATPSASPMPHSKPTGPTPKFIVPGGGQTGQWSQGAPSMAFCAGNLYTAFTGADDHVNLVWGFNGSGYNHQVAYADTTYMAFTNPTTYTRPVLACWQAPGDITRLWIFFTGTNQILYLGYYVSGDENQPWEEVRTHYKSGQHIAVPNQTANRSPALSPLGSTLRIGWVGDGNGYLNFESFNGSSFSTQITKTNSTADGGFGMTSWCTGSPSVCRVWFAYPGTDSQHHIYVEDFNLSSGAWENSEFGHPTADFTCHICDLTLVLQSGTLRIPYSGGGPDILNVDNSTDGGQSWSNDPSDAAGSQWGAGAAVDSNNQFWICFPNYNSLQAEPLQLVQFQYP